MKNGNIGCFGAKTKYKKNSYEICTHKSYSTYLAVARMLSRYLFIFTYLIALKLLVKKTIEFSL